MVRAWSEPIHPCDISCTWQDGLTGRSSQGCISSALLLVDDMIQIPTVMTCLEEFSLLELRLKRHCSRYADGVDAKSEKYSQLLGLTVLYLTGDIDHFGTGTRQFGVPDKTGELGCLADCRKMILLLMARCDRSRSSHAIDIDVPMGAREYVDAP